MSRLLAPLLPALLAGCIASATAQESHDVLTLTSGERLVGELVDVRDGRYWVLLTDGRLVSADFRTVALVEMAGRSLDPVAKEDLPVPLWDEPEEEEEYRPIGTGFDFGLVQGGRVRFRIGTPAISHVDVKAGLGLVYASGIGFGFITGGEVAFFGKSPVHLTLSANAGPALIYGSFYPFVGLGAGFQFDPPGAFEVHLGLNVGTTFSYFAATPDLALAWVW